MADRIKIAESVVKVTTTNLGLAGGYWGARQPLDQAIDISGYGRLDLQVNVVELSGSAKLYLITSMQKDVEDGTWDIANAPDTQFVQITTTGSWGAVIASSGNKPLLQYLRWMVVTSASNQASTIAFTLVGLAHRLSL